jgi:excisionase family DNA binding protein
MDNGMSASGLLEPKREKPERSAYTIHEVADMLGVHYFAVYWLVQKKKLHACRAIPGKLLIARSEVIRLLHVE